MTDFSKVYKTAKNSIKTTINVAISNEMNFSVQIVPLTQSDGADFPPSEDVFEFTECYVKDTMKYKVSSGKALAGMQKKWIQQHGPDVPFVEKKQASELLVILIAPSDECIHVFYSIPETFNFTVPEKSIEVKWVQGETKEIGTRTICYSQVNAPDDITLFKYRDHVSQEILNELKRQGVYVEDDDSEDEMCYDF